MKKNKFDERLYVGMPAVYRIKIKGRINAGLSESLGGLKIEIFDKEEQEPFTILEGPLKDQAELMGVLTSLKDLKCSLLGVEVVSMEHPPDTKH